MIGQGYQNSNVHGFIKNHFLRNPHIYSPYTPYQAEISQGRLELLHRYQTMIENVTKTDIAVASMLDSGQVAMDLITLMKNKTKKDKVLVQNTTFQTVKNCINTRAKHQQLIVEEFSSNDNLLNKDLEPYGGIIYQTPDTYGNVNSLSSLGQIKSRFPHLVLACNTDLMTNIYYDIGDHADFMFGNGNNFGIGLNYGGPQPTFLGAKANFIRDLPGKIVAETFDARRNPAFRLALQTREQHIKREKATSNICTNQALLANMSVAWAMFMGNAGLKDTASSIFAKTQYLYEQLSTKFPVQILNTTFFNTISFAAPETAYLALKKHNVFGHYFKDLGILSLTIDETHTFEDIDYALSIITSHLKEKSHTVNLGDTSTSASASVSDNKAINQPPRRHSVPLQAPYLSRYEGDEQSLMRYLYQLGVKDYSLMNGLIPLGSCTMKHTPSDSMEKATDETMNIHPYVSLQTTPYFEVVHELADRLKDITGFDEVFFQSQSGAMGEYAGLTTIRNYFESRGIADKKYILMPKSAHGTNASSSQLAGFSIVHINETREGMIDMDHFNELIEQYQRHIAGLMITYPSTYGLYEKNIEEINQIIHTRAEGLVYMDGANMNALMGMKCDVKSLGFDLCHFNLHKTFAVPHGGGGPGMGPIAVTKTLIPYLPKFSTHESCESISTSKYGSGLILQISNQYLKTFDDTDPNFRSHHTQLLNRTKEVINCLSEKYTIYHTSGDSNAYRAHEFIIDTSEFDEVGVTELDISKRLMDYGFHAPTMSWPIRKSLMIEITETESTIEMKRFIDAMLNIYDEIFTNPKLLKNAPHTQYDITDWTYDYSVSQGCYPAGRTQIRRKFWPTINRIDEVTGDKMLLQRARKKKD